MDCHPKKYWYGKGGTIIHIMKGLGIPGFIRCTLIKVFIDIDQFIQCEIYYSEKFNRNNMGKTCVIYNNYVEANIISNYI